MNESIEKAEASLDRQEQLTMLCSFVVFLMGEDVDLIDYKTKERLTATQLTALRYKFVDELEGLPAFLRPQADYKQEINWEYPGNSDSTDRAQTDEILDFF